VNKQEEVELARALIGGQAEAFEHFVAHFRTKIFQYTWLMCGQREDAEEVAQETLLKVFEKLSQLEDPEHIRPWVFRIARNECLMMRRKSVFAPSRELSLDEFLPAVDRDGEHRHIQIADWSALPDDRLLRSELREEIDRGIRELPESYRAVVLLRDIEELSTEETARILDLTPDVVKTRLHRGRLALRQKLDSYLRGVESA
jgi:RNA polymerase sigma-70 factor (ECF subfamily)